MWLKTLFLGLTFWTTVSKGAHSSNSLSRAKGFSDDKLLWYLHSKLKESEPGKVYPVTPLYSLHSIDCILKNILLTHFLIMSISLVQYTLAKGDRTGLLAILLCTVLLALTMGPSIQLDLSELYE